MDGPPHDPHASDRPSQSASPTPSDRHVDEVCRPREFNYSFLGSGQQEEIILRDRIDIGCWSTIGLSIRVHSIRAAAGARFTINILGTAPSPEDGADFVTSKLASRVLGGTAPSLEQISVPLTELQVPFLRVVLQALGPTSPPGEVYCEISCDLVLKAQ